MKIAIIGPICSGKTTIAKYFQKNHNYIKLSFGDALKKYCAEIFNMEYKNRILLQDFGKKTREIDPLVWVKHVEKQINKLKFRDIIVDDVRYPNEYLMLKRQGFLFIKLDILKDLQIERLKKTYPNTYNEHLQRLEHESESHIKTLVCNKTFKINKNTQDDLVQNIILYIFN